MSDKIKSKNLFSVYGPISLSTFLHMTFLITCILIFKDQYLDEDKNIGMILREEENSKIVTLEVEKPDFDTDLEFAEIESPVIDNTVELFELLNTVEPVHKELKVTLEPPKINDLETFETETFTGIQPIDFNSYKPLSNALSNRGRKEKMAALKEYGGSVKAQRMLQKSLRWLLKVQNPDGSWGVHFRYAMTGLASLSIMAYGTQPKTQYLGPSLIKSLEWMINAVENPDTSFESPALRKVAKVPGMQGSSGYEHAIFTFALAEATTLYSRTDLEACMNKCVDVILKGQNPDGGFDYDYQGEGESVLTLTGWNYLALKAAYNSGFGNSEIYEALEKVRNFLIGRYSPERKTFLYMANTPNIMVQGVGSSSLRGIGLLGLQLLDDPNNELIGTILKSSIREDLRSFSWDVTKESIPFYSWYYLTQVYFNHGGELWRLWKDKFQRELYQSQYATGYWDMKVTKNKRVWKNPAGTALDNQIMCTTLSSLMLTVFYRYLPINKIIMNSPEEIEEAPPENIEEEEELDLFVE